MRMLYGKELADYIKVRQAQRVRVLTQSFGLIPKLAIITTIDNPIIDLYVRLKIQYAKDIGIQVDVHRVSQQDAYRAIGELNSDKLVHGIIIQLPLEDKAQTEELVNLVSPEKDVDALGEKAKFDPATPKAILWLLAGFNIDLQNKKVVLVGRGKLVGRPLERMLNDSGVDVSVADRTSKSIANMTLEADVIITATGSRSAITTDMVKKGAIVVDAGVASENGKTFGDVDDQLYERLDLTITPKKGGVGPLTICALFDNVIIATERLSE